MMKIKCKNILVLVLLFISVAMNGQLYFNNGMKWRTEVDGTTDPFPNPRVEVVTLEGTTEDNCIKMYRFYEDNISKKTMIALIKTEGEKVYFKFDDSETSEWYLMYDFGLNVGEGCYVYKFYKTDEPERFKTYIKCVGISEASEPGGWTMMELEEYEDDTCIDPRGMSNQGTWIKGLSSLDGVLWNNRFGDDGVSGKLMEAFDNGTLIYSRGNVGVEETISETIPEIKVDGRSISVSTKADSCGSLFSQSGQHIGDYTFTVTPTLINVPDSGVYILKIGKFTKKMLIQ